MPRWPARNPQLQTATLGIMVLTHTADYLSECLTSVNAQTCPPTAKVLIDNGSPAAEQVAAIGKSFGFHVVRSDLPVHYTIGRNLGCQVLDGCDLIVNLDGDDVLLPGFVEHYWRVAKDERADIVYGCAEYIGDRTGIFGANFDRAASRIRQRNVIPANSLFSRDIWQRVGGFDSTIGLLDDWDFWLSCLEAGATARFVDVPLWQYRRHPSSNLSDSDSAREQKIAYSAALVTEKHRRYIDGLGGWRRAQRWVDRRTGRVRRGIARRLRRLGRAASTGSRSV